MSTPDMSTYVVAIGHPSLQSLVGPFVETIRTETRRFDRAGIRNPKPFPSLIRKVTDPDRRLFGVMTDGELVGMGSLADDGEVAMAIAATHRGRGIGTCLLQHLALTAERDGYTRLLMESSRRSRPIAQLGTKFGWTSFDLPHGRVEMTLQLPSRATG
ncbi:GNAT family N-acetyltransferase [Ilumatobacter nonamiensis]|uniref:GNAT family N-acetyltransferase n=1 Tax=Ilumatobacter nonamiensis TaxID=467093 RepID=UPI00034AB000|nr:GNAT family N-acetyltransferase [Ilumatobacter nonamiensis]